MSEYVNLLDVLTKDRKLPPGCDTWAIRSVRPDGASSFGFRWPLYAGWVEAPGPINYANASPSPVSVGDGICLAYSWGGMALGGVAARTLLLCAYSASDVLGGAPGGNITRLSRAHVAAVIDGERLIREHGRGAKLSCADLRGAYLRGADLADADLYCADLEGADLDGADLDGADLRSAYLRGANLSCADLRGANLYGANLRGANLRGANLPGANLRGADLFGANLRAADLFGANLRGADLPGANLRDADLRDADLGVWERDPETGLARRKAVRHHA